MLTDALLGLTGVAGALLAAWALLLLALVVMRPAGMSAAEGLRLMPDLLRLLRSLAADRSLAWTVRLRGWVALAYVVSPIDPVPDFLPVIGLVDEVVVVAVLLRSMIRRAGPQVVGRHWRGTAQGLAVVHRLCGLPSAPPASG
ncbi:DUF1232 domain-containing protein [Streptomonospora halophila]|uniref:DUF1232 domain-containing protein n=1 Tax=Streptomonospora halophila TaxID=427369 RepID=A0ABP9GMF4_9ACTN